MTILIIFPIVIAPTGKQLLIGYHHHNLTTAIEAGDQSGDTPAKNDIPGSLLSYLST